MKKTHSLQESVTWERFESRSYFISRLRMIARVNEVLNKTVVDSDWSFDNLCPVVIFRVKVSCITSGDGIKLWFLIGLVN